MDVIEGMNGRLRAAEKYMGEKGWVQEMEAAADGAVCLTGAIRQCSGRGDEEVIIAVLRCMDRAEVWNDAEERTEAEVRYLLAKQHIGEEELSEILGPEWRRVVTLFRQAVAVVPWEMPEPATLAPQLPPELQGGLVWVRDWTSVPGSPDIIVNALYLIADRIFGEEVAYKKVAMREFGEMALYGLMKAGEMEDHLREALVKPWQELTGQELVPAE